MFSVSRIKKVSRISAAVIVDNLLLSKYPDSFGYCSIVNMGSIGTAGAKPLGSYPDSGIDVLIVGTGLAGLTAALECTRKGHSVRVFERHATINTAGVSRANQNNYVAFPADWH